MTDSIQNDYIPQSYTVQGHAKDSNTVHAKDSNTVHNGIKIVKRTQQHKGHALLGASLLGVHTTGATGTLRSLHVCLFLQKLLGKKKQYLTSSSSEGGVENGHGAVDRASTVVVAEADKLTSTSVNVDCVDVNGSTPLILAALHGHREVLSSLLLYSANVNAEDYLGWVKMSAGVWVGGGVLVS